MKSIAALALTTASLAPASVALAAQGAPPVTVAEDLAGQTYVAIGSSFAAGPMLPPAKPGNAPRCGQSQSNYPTLLAQRLGMVLVDRSCSGATTDHVLGPWAEVPPQIDAVTADTRLVTLTIGGNDLGYIGNLFTASCLFNARLAPVSADKPQRCAAMRVPTEADYTRDEAQLNAIAARVRAQAPRARLVFVQYLTPLPPAGQLCEATPVDEENAAVVREIGRRLSAITARVAQANGALVVGMDSASVVHTPCDAEPWMIGFPAGWDVRQGLQWHLNKAGMQATADGIASELARSGVKVPSAAPERAISATR